MKKILTLLVVLLAAVLVFCAANFLDTNNPFHTVPTEPEIRGEAPAPTEPAVTGPEPTSVTEPEVTEPPAPEEFLLTFVGDCTLGCNESHAFMEYGFKRTIGDDFGHPFRNVLSYFESDDLTFINLEGPLTDTITPAGKPHVFRGMEAYIDILTQNSVEVVSLANNHTQDHREQGYEKTRELLDGAQIPYVERDASRIITTEEGLTIGIYGAVYFLMEEEVILDAISELDKQVDLVIFAPHWGYEHTYRPYEAQVELAHAVIDAGADIIWGSHPHVLQPIEEYNGGIIYYSMGNFSFGGNIYPGDYDTALIQQQILRDPDGTVRLGERTIIPASCSSIFGRNNFQPTPYEEGSEEYLRALSKLDGTFDGPNLPLG